MYKYSEHLKLIRAALRAYDSENQKCGVLKEILDDYEIHVYRVRHFKFVFIHSTFVDFSSRQKNLVVYRLHFV